MGFNIHPTRLYDTYLPPKPSVGLNRRDPWVDAYREWHRRINQIAYIVECLYGFRPLRSE